MTTISTMRPMMDTLTRTAAPAPSPQHAAQADAVSISSRTSNPQPPASSQAASQQASPSAPLVSSSAQSLSRSLLDTIHDEVISLTQSLVQVDSGPDNLVAGENVVCDRMEAYARQAGLGVDRFETVNGKPVLVISLAGSDPSLGSVGFVHHSDVVGTEGEWHLGKPFSGDVTHDEKGREVLVGRGSVDTKGPAAQVLVGMKYLKQAGKQPERTMKLYIFPDEETGGTDGAYFVSRNMPQKISDVQYWVVEGSGILGKDTMGIDVKQDTPYLAVAQKYTLPVQIRLKTPTTADDAVKKTLGALERLDTYADKMQWSYLGDKKETKEMFNRLGHLVGGFKGWVVRHFWCAGLVRKGLGTSVAAANKTDYCKTDFYLSDNAAATTKNPNVKPSSVSMVMQISLSGADRTVAIERMAEAAGSAIKVEPLEDLNNGKPTIAVRLSLPQENYVGGHHGSTPDREHDAVDVVDRAVTNVQKAFKKAGQADRLQIVDVFTTKSDHAPQSSAAGPVTSTVTLDLRVAVDNDRQQVLKDIEQRIGGDFELVPLYGQEEIDAHVRRLTSQSPLFKSAETYLQSVYGVDNVLFGNTTASNDCRYLGDANPRSETLAFVPVLYTEHGAHSPDECTTVDSLKKGVDWCIGMMEHLGSQKNLS